MRRGRAIAVLALLLAAPAQAQVRPHAAGGDPRLQEVDYRSDQIVRLEVAPGYQLGVEFAPDERIESVAVGNSGAWLVTASQRGNQLFLKPTQANAATNMTVITDTRTYRFDLEPLPGPLSDMAYAVRFNYPRPAGRPETAAAARAVVVTQYRLSGDRRLRPSAISDDGTRTYIEWPADAALPAVYAVDDRGRELLVNGMMRDGLYVIDSVSPRLAFRIDDRVARAKRQLPRGSR